MARQGAAPQGLNDEGLQGNAEPFVLLGVDYETRYIGGMAAPEPVVPTCRYGHGNLVFMRFGDNDRQWGLLADKALHAANLLGAISFFVQLYMCPKCGYIELFDAEPTASLANNDKKYD